MIKKILKELYIKLTEIGWYARRTIVSRLFHTKIQYGSHTNIGKRVRILPGTRIYNPDNSEIFIGENSILCSFCKVIMTRGKGGKLHIGHDVTLGEYNVVNVFGNVTIGDSVQTADRVSFITNTHNYQDISIPIRDQGGEQYDISIGDGSWLGINATVLAGTTIGRNCVVGANSVVKGNFPDYCVIAGCPGRIVKYYDTEKKMWVRAGKDKRE